MRHFQLLTALSCDKLFSRYDVLRMLHQPISILHLEKWIDLCIFMVYRLCLPWRGVRYQLGTVVALASTSRSSCMQILSTSRLFSRLIACADVWLFGGMKWYLKVITKRIWRRMYVLLAATSCIHSATFCQPHQNGKSLHHNRSTYWHVIIQKHVAGNTSCGDDRGWCPSW